MIDLPRNNGWIIEMHENLNASLSFLEIGNLYILHVLSEIINRE